MRTIYGGEDGFLVPVVIRGEETDDNVCFPKVVPRRAWSTTSSGLGPSKEKADGESSAIGGLM